MLKHSGCDCQSCNLHVNRNVLRDKKNLNTFCFFLKSDLARISSSVCRKNYNSAYCLSIWTFWVDNFFLKKCQRIIAFVIEQKKIRLLSKVFLPDCQIPILRAQRIFSRSSFSMKLLVFPSLSDHERKVFGLLSHLSGGTFKSAICVFLGKLWGKILFFEKKRFHQFWTLDKNVLALLQRDFSRAVKIQFSVSIEPNEEE